MCKKNIVLAIETAFAGGCISIFREENEIGRWIGQKHLAVSKDILEEVSILLNKNEIKREHIQLIAISRDVGSLTGLRVGKALAFGLSKSLNCEYREVSVLKSLLNAGEKTGNILTAICVERGEFWYQIFYTGKGRKIVELNSAERCDSGEIKKICAETIFDDTLIYSIERREFYLNESDKNPLEKVDFPEKKSGFLSKYIGLSAMRKAK